MVGAALLVWPHLQVMAAIAAQGRCGDGCSPCWFGRQQAAVFLRGMLCLLPLWAEPKAGSLAASQLPKRQSWRWLCLCRWRIRATPLPLPLLLLGVAS